MIAVQYKKHFDCELKHFMPRTFNLYEGKNLKACTGFTPAGNQALFLEQYFDRPIEALLSEKFKTPVDRSTICEIGGFAVDNKRYVLPFMLELAPAFRAQGFQFAVCTVTSPVRACLRKLGIQSVCLGKANAERVDTSDNAWGNYYQLSPVVLAGDIQANIDRLMPLLKLF